MDYAHLMAVEHSLQDLLNAMTACKHQGRVLVKACTGRPHARSQASGRRRGAISAGPCGPGRGRRSPPPFRSAPLGSARTAPRRPPLRARRPQAPPRRHRADLRDVPPLARSAFFGLFKFQVSCSKAMFSQKRTDLANLVRSQQRLELVCTFSCSFTKALQIAAAEIETVGGQVF